MERQQINENDLEKVIGGTIVFNADCTTCGYFRNDQYKVLNFNAVLDYIKENKTKMSESKMLKNMVAAGLLANL